VKRIILETGFIHVEILVLQKIKVNIINYCLKTISMQIIAKYKMEGYKYRYNNILLK